MKASSTVRNAQLSAIETAIGTSPKLLLYTGTQPAAITDAASGTLLATLTLPSDWLGSPSGGVAAKAGTWQGTGSSSGDCGYWRVTSSAGTAHLQGTMTATGGGGELTMDDVTIAIGQTITVNPFTLTAGNA